MNKKESIDHAHHRAPSVDRFHQLIHVHFHENNLVFIKLNSCETRSRNREENCEISHTGL